MWANLIIWFVWIFTELNLILTYVRPVASQSPRPSDLHIN